MQSNPWCAVRLIEVRAGRIRDPVKRLRFLRRTIRSLPADEVPEVADVADVAEAPKPARWRPRAPLLAASLFFVLAGTVSDAGRVPAAPRASPPAAPRDPAHVWLVERARDWELYSNGLRVETLLATSTRPRLYPVLERATLPEAAWRWRTEPAGIVFHASEGELASFEPQQNGPLKRQVLGLLDYARRHGLYHFVVDRFGRVHRIVEEGDAADHAGQSVWADSTWVYLNLNAGFLGVAFEAQTSSGGEAGWISPAQLHAGKVLTEMLRSKYRLPAGNCVTHAQVSVNPHNFRIGYHSDWAHSFPFEQLGLPDNYRQPLPSLLLFGFGYDPAFLASAGASLQDALLRAEEQVRQEAAARGLTVARWQAALNRKYRQISRQTAEARVAFGRPPRPEESP